MSKPTLPFLAKASRKVGAAVGAFAKAEPPISAPPPSYEDIVRANWRQILTEWMVGEAMEDIGKKLKPLPVPGAEVRRIFKSDPDLRDRLATAKSYLADHLFDRAVQSALKAEKSGEYGVAFKSLASAAAILDKSYSARTVLAGDPEAPIPVVHSGEVTAKLEPSEAYARMIGGAK